jgi:hypothetical protein
MTQAEQIIAALSGLDARSSREHACVRDAFLLGVSLGLNVLPSNSAVQAEATAAGYGAADYGSFLQNPSVQAVGS